MLDLNVKTLFDLEDFLHKALFEDAAFVWEALHRLSTYLENQKLGKIESFVPPTAHLVHPEKISIGKDCIIEPGAYIEGPCILGPGTVVRHGAYIRGHVITGARCVIGHTTEIKHSILLNDAHAAHFNYVGDSILGNRVNLGAGVKCANFRLDHKPVPVVFQGKKLATQLKKLGAIIGDDAQLGCNCVTNPGTILGKKSFSYPCLNIDGCIPEGAVVRPAQKNTVR